MSILQPTLQGEIVRRFGFKAMASDCELLCDTEASTALRIAEVVQQECQRIEARYSRYRSDSVLSELNAGAGQWQSIDDELFRLLSFADRAHQISGGLFDISSGLLRRHWPFGETDAPIKPPEKRALKHTLEHVGWHRVKLQRNRVRLPSAYALDLGGIAKEYAADRCAALAGQVLQGGAGGRCLINLGGDLAVVVVGVEPLPWRVGIEVPRGRQTLGGAPSLLLSQGAVATSGITRRFLTVDGRRLGHLLDPRSGWPVPSQPLSVTVQAERCIEAGFLASYAVLSGADAEAVLGETGVSCWVWRESD